MVTMFGTRLSGCLLLRSALPRPLSSLASASFLMLFAVCAHADTLNVPTADFPTIQAAIDAAGAGDTIVVAAGTYHESLQWSLTDLTIQGAGAGQTVVDPSAANGGPGGRCLTVTNRSAASKLSGFTFQNGTSSSLGGGMYNDHSSPTVTNCTFSNNTVHGSDSDDPAHGGGMYNFNSSPTVINCIFSNNKADSTGAMFNDHGRPTVTSCAFISNSARSVGAMTNFLCNAAVTNCIFWGNSTPFDIGGGMLNYMSSPVVTNCTFSNNSARAGGAMYNNNSGPTVINCIIWGNSASMAGGGIFNFFSSPGVSYSDVQDLLNATPDGNGNFAADPLFVNAPTGNLRLLPGSPCVNAGTNAAVSTPPFPTDGVGNPLDLDDNPRINLGSVDMGAYEWVAPPTANPQSVSVTADSPAPITLSGSDPNSPPLNRLAFTVTTPPSHGTLSGAAQNLVYTPDPTYSGADSFQFIVTNAAQITSAPATVSLNVVLPPSTLGAHVNGAGDISLGGSAQAHFDLDVHKHNNGKLELEGHVHFQGKDGAQKTTPELNDDRTTVITSLVVNGSNARVFGYGTLKGTNTVVSFVMDVTNGSAKGPGHGDTFSI